jgi:acetoacetate decarboxylase
MGFVRTPEEIERIQAAIANPVFPSAETLQVDFLTDPATIERILPPGLEPGDTPRVTASLGRWQSNCCGDFEGGAIFVSARHGELAGDYVLAQYFNTDHAMLYGREVFGEPKKHGTVHMVRRADRMHGWIERGGVRLVELDVELTDDAGPTTSTTLNFNYKARPAANGIGLSEDAILTKATFEADLRLLRTGTGTVTLRGTALDPLDELEVVEVIAARYLEGDLVARCEAVATVPADEFLPYQLGRMDDWSALDTQLPSPSASGGALSRAATAR